MKTTSKLYFLLFILCAAFAYAQTSAGESARRIGFGRQKAMEFIKGNPKASSEEAAKAVMAALKLQFPELAKAPVKKPITEMDTFSDYNRRFQQVLDRKYPVFTPQQLEIIAAERYPLYMKGDTATVYFVRGNHIESVTGRIFFIDDVHVQVGTRKILFEDMKPVKGNDVELLKFLPEPNREAREAYKKVIRDQTERQRADFRLNNRQEVEALLLDKDRQINEANGYTYCDQRWMDVSELARWLTAVAVETLENQRYEAMNANMSHRRLPIENQRLTLAMKFEHERPGNVFNPQAHQSREAQKLKAQQSLDEARARLQAEAQKEAEAKLAAVKAAKEAKEKKEKELALAKAEKKRKAEEEAKAAAAEEAKAAEEAAKAAEEARLAAKQAREKEQRERELAEQRRLEEEAQSFFAGEVGGIPMPVLIIIGGLVVLGGLGTMIVLILKKRNGEKEDTFKKFFEGKGKLQKDFWSQAEADPVHFKYVAYMFPTMEDATKALAHLSYMRQGGSGEVKCTRQLHYGVYPHQDAAVCFVGGVKFSYALWREASAVLPELPGAQYFKVSTEPQVLLDIPDLDKLMKDKNMQIESLGVEEQEGEHGEFNRIYRYRAASRDDAMVFLENFNINEAGIIVHVETPDGILGKDENGVFSLEENALGQKDDGESPSPEKDGVTEEQNEPADEPPADEPPADTPADEPPADEPPADESPADEPPVKMPRLKKLKAPKAE